MINSGNLTGIALFAGYASIALYLLIELLLKGRIPVVNIRIKFLKDWYSHLPSKYKRLIAWLLSILLITAAGLANGMNIPNSILAGLLSGFGSTTLNDLIDKAKSKVRRTNE